MISPADRASIRRAALQVAGPVVARLGRQARACSPESAVIPPGAPRVLLIRPDHLGDLLLASPAAQVLASALPEARIDWLVGPWSAEVARRCGGSGEVLTVPFPGFTRKPKRSALEPYRVLATEATRLRASRYDAALILRPDHWWGALLAAAAGIPRRFGYGVAECLPFLTDTLPLPSGRQQHAVRTNQALARLAAVRLGGRPPSKTMHNPVFPLDEADRAWAADWLDAHQTNDGVAAALSERPERGHAPLVVLHPGSGARLKNWPSERWADVIRVLRAETGAQIVLTGGPAERELVESIAARLDPSPFMLVGATTLGQLAALFASADLVLGGDSGPLHLAAAVGTPTVRVYGPTDIAEFGPWPPGPQQVALAANLSCQPCRALTDPPCGATERPACLDAVSVAMGVTVATRTLAVTAARRAMSPSMPSPSPKP